MKPKSTPIKAKNSLNPPLATLAAMGVPPAPGSQPSTVRGASRNSGLCGPNSPGTMWPLEYQPHRDIRHCCQQATTFYIVDDIHCLQNVWGISGVYLVFKNSGDKFKCVWANVFHIFQKQEINQAHPPQLFQLVTKANLAQYTKNVRTFFS